MKNAKNTKDILDAKKVKDDEKALNKLEIEKRVFEYLDKKHSLSHISEITSAIIDVLKNTMKKGENIKIPGLMSTKVKEVKSRQFVSINTPRIGNAKPVKTHSLPHKRIVVKVSKELQKMLNGHDTKKVVAKKTTKTVKPTITKKK